MLNRFARAFFTKLFTPVARLLLRLGISPDIVTIVGTVGVCFGALAFYPRHEFFWGTIVITLFVFSDTIDGVMARMSGRSVSTIKASVFFALEKLKKFVKEPV